MRKLILNRGKGKTTRLLYTSSVMGYPILVATGHRAKHLIQMAQTLELGSIPKPITVSEMINDSTMGRRDSKVLIDDAEDVVYLMLQHFGVVPMAISLSKEDSNL